MSVGDDATKRVSELAQLAHAIAAAPDEDAGLQLVDSAISLIRRVDHARITINAKPGLAKRVSSDDVVTCANQMQNEMGDRPCLDVLRDADTLISSDLAREERWPRWAAQVRHELGVNSVMSLLVYTDRHSFGTLSLHAQHGKHFDQDDLVVSESLAGHLAVIMAAEREIEQLGSALPTRIIIGQAEGNLMERSDLNVDQAFDYLRRVSSHTNRKLIDIATEIAHTRKLPTRDQFGILPAWVGRGPPTVEDAALNTRDYHSRPPREDLHIGHRLRRVPQDRRGTEGRESRGPPPHLRGAGQDVRQDRRGRNRPG